MTSSFLSFQMSPILRERQIHEQPPYPHLSHQEVECKARAEEKEPYGWWTCKVSAFAGVDSEGEEQFTVSFIGWGDQHNETLGRSFIRRQSRAQCLSSRNMMKKRYRVPPSLDEWVEEHCRGGSILGKLMPHRNIASQIVHVYYSQQVC